MKSVFISYLITSLLLLATTEMCSGESVNVVESPYDLQEELLLVQLVTPSVTANVLEYDSGIFIYKPDIVHDFEAALFSEGLIFEADAFGNLVAAVHIFEDFESRDTVYLNSEDQIIFRIPPLYGYNPFWVLQALYPDISFAGDLLYQYDPSRVIMKAVLLRYKQNSDVAAFSKSPIFSDYQITPKDSGDIPPFAGLDGRKKPMGPVVRSERVDNSALTNRTTVVIRKKRVDRDIYVDDECGSAVRSGQAKVQNTDKRFKSSIKDGLNAVQSHGRVYIAGGRYADKINVRGKKVKVCIEGTVVLTKKRGR